jgi:hypothetical protein
MKFTVKKILLPNISWSYFSPVILRAINKPLGGDQQGLAHLLCLIIREKSTLPLKPCIWAWIGRDRECRNDPLISMDIDGAATLPYTEHRELQVTLPPHPIRPRHRPRSPEPGARGQRRHCSVHWLGCWLRSLYFKINGGGEGDWKRLTFWRNSVLMNYSRCLILIECHISLLLRFRFFYLLRRLWNVAERKSK